MNCKKCGSLLENSAKFCGQCGESTASTIVARPITGAAKECPACHGQVSVAKSICPHCGRRFDIEELRKAALGPPAKPQDIAAFIGFSVVVAGLIGIALYSCVYVSPEDLKRRQAAEAAAMKDAESARIERAEDVRNGFHCLSAWNGTHRNLVSKVKDHLRDPESFEHAETKITPRDAKGQHMLFMTYRARNGFGGMNVAKAIATVDGSTCEATVLAVGN